MLASISSRNLAKKKTYAEISFVDVAGPQPKTPTGPIGS
jgi:hypothetical protein